VHARRADASDHTQVCLAVDLFEVIAELAGLDLEDDVQSAQALALADEAQRRLGFRVGPGGVRRDERAR